MSDYEGPKYCFIPGPTRLCQFSCMAYVNEGKTSCRILNAVERLIPSPTRPVAPTPQISLGNVMKTMVVTGLSNEQDFETGQSIFVLILNKKFRVPVSEEVATEIIQEMYDSEMGTPETRPSSISSDSSEDDDGVDQI